MYKRYDHTIPRTKKATYPKSIIFFDTETKENRVDASSTDLTLKLGVAVLTAYTRGKGLVAAGDCIFHSNDALHRWLDSILSGRHKYIIVAHNIAFDIRITGLTKHLQSTGWTRGKTIIEGLKFLITYTKPLPDHRCTTKCQKRAYGMHHEGPHTTITLMNNQMLFPTSLRELGESIGTYKEHIDFRAATDDELIEYCRQDVEVMRSAWEKWLAYLADNDLGSFQYTTASQALHTYRHRFMHAPIKVHTHPKAIALERESYHGGRVECFRIGEQTQGPYYCLDINSMYPHIMRDYPVPAILSQYFPSISLEDFAHIRKHNGYVVEATLTSSRADLPVVHDNRLLFPTGTITGVFSKPELEAALGHSTLESVGRIAIYRDEHLFTDFVDFFYSARRRFKAEGNTAFAYFSKLMMNSLYGKFGQRTTEYTPIGYNPSLPDSSGEIYDLAEARMKKYRRFDGLTEIESKTEEGYHSFVAIASYITGAARAYLAQLMRQAGDGHVLYCDTDSIFVDSVGYENLKMHLDDAALGALKVEEVSDTLAIFGPKRYRIGSKVRSKGIRRDAVRLPDGSYRQVQFEGFQGALRKARTDRVRLTQITKRLSDEYMKGVVEHDGSVTPFRFPQA